MDFLGKELVGTYYYTDMFMDRSGVKPMKINGREFYRCGTYQAVTMVGNLYEYYDPIVEHHKKFLMVGMAKQHPRDLTINKSTGYEIANENAHINPCIIMEVDDINKDKFMMMCDAYISCMVNRKFVCTAKEISLTNTFNECNG